LTALTVIPLGATAGARPRVNAPMAPFVALYANSSDMGPSHWPEVMLMIRPPSLAKRRANCAARSTAARMLTE
jgi:hypothetical protein